MSDWFDDNDTQIDTGISKALLNYLPIGYELITTANDLRGIFAPCRRPLGPRPFSL